MEKETNRFCDAWVDSFISSNDKAVDLFVNLDEGYSLNKVVYDSEGKPVDFIVVYVNDECERIIGLKREDIVNRPISQAIRGIEKPDNPIETVGMVAKTGKPAKFEVYLQPLNRWVSVYAYSPKKDYFVAVFHDITKNQQAEDALRKSEEHFRSVLDSSADVIYRFNLQTNRYEYMSPSISALGFEPQEMTAMTNDEVLSRVHPQDLPSLKKEIERCFKTGKGFSEYRFKGKDDQYRWWSNQMILIKDATGKPLYRDGAVRDISKSKKIEEDLKVATELLSKENEGLSKLHEISLQFVSEENMQGLLNTILKASIEITHADMGTIQLCEKGNTLRIVAHQGLDQDFLDFFYDVDEDTPAVCSAAMKNKRRVFVEDLTKNPLIVNAASLDVQLKAGVRAVQSTPLFSRFGRFLGIISTHYKTPTKPDKTDLRLLDLLVRQAADYIERIYNEQKLEAYKNNLEFMVEEKTQQLKDSERLAAIGQTAGMVGHDIRNPLQAIVSELYLAKENIRDAPESNCKSELIDSLNFIQQQVDYMNKIIADLQDYARNTAPTVSKVNLEGIIQDAFVGMQIPDNIKVILKIEPDIELISDRDYLRRVTTNLSTNAIQAMPKGGELTVEVKKQKRNKIQITVADTGEGIPEEVQDKLFRPLFTTKSKGQGLGLAVVKKFVEQLGGTITFQTKEGRGTQFKIELPLRYKAPETI
ncbi:MAG: ATP-binding protein [Candidatus Bathyarchaeota archaeon]|nr:ATP-binding protein [Candidatus Bathyarchaeota archaeon]